MHAVRGTIKKVYSIKNQNELNFSLEDIKQFSRKYHTHPAKLAPDDLPNFKKDIIELLNKYKLRGEQSAEVELFNLSIIMLPEEYYESKQ